MEIPKRYWRNFDIPLLLTVFGLILFGTIIVYSASASRLLSAGDDPTHYVKRQALFTLIGVVGMILTLSIDYRAWRRWTRMIYASNLALLVSVLFFGTAIFGSQRWFRIGPFNLQPSELAKIAIILVLARLLEKRDNIKGCKILLPFAIVAVPMLLIMAQPDMGTSMVFVGILFSMLYLAGANTRHLILLISSGVVTMFLAIFVSLKEWIPIIKPYQLTRLLVFLDPYADRTHSGWNIIQSMIAIGSGGFLGKGLTNGTQSQLNFLPANHTDFVFSVIAEELGFVGAIILFSLYMVVIWRGLRIALMAKDQFGTLLAAGCVSMFVFHLIINVGMSLGIMPVTGLPLPFITAGGSTLLTSLLAIGILLNVGLRRNKIMF